jgi:hypothetical protein
LLKKSALFTSNKYTKICEPTKSSNDANKERVKIHGHNLADRYFIEASSKVDCPVLFLVCEYDNLISPGSHKRGAEVLGDKAEVKKYPIGHFDIYEGGYFEDADSEMIAFLQKHPGWITTAVRFLPRVCGRQLTHR